MKKVIILSFLSLLVACKSKSAATRSGATSTATMVSDCKFKVMFISIGEGTDGKKIEALDNLLKEKYPKVKPVITQRGREGEVNYCFSMDKMKQKDQETFKNDIKKAMEGSKLVQFEG